MSRTHVARLNSLTSLQVYANEFARWAWFFIGGLCYLQRNLHSVQAPLSLGIAGYIHTRRKQETQLSKQASFLDIKFRVTRDVLGEYQDQMTQSITLMERTKKEVDTLTKDLSVAKTFVEKKKSDVATCRGDRKRLTDEIAAATSENKHIQSEFVKEKTQWASELASLKRQLEQQSTLCKYIDKNSEEGRKLCNISEEPQKPKPNEPNVEKPKAEMGSNVPTGHILLIAACLLNTAAPTLSVNRGECTFNTKATCEYQGQVFGIGESWITKDCYQCVCMEPFGVGCCDHNSLPVDYPEWCEVIRKPDSCISIWCPSLNNIKNGHQNTSRHDQRRITPMTLVSLVFENKCETENEKHGRGGINWKYHVA
ncbi:hypothetical protein Q8A67_008053 [Cirrhinus molitorella]|uniref:Uncharacterized protein n=1 Tax=Cirrhinus molitorella TaxID=172907 RepID=A0AA88TSE9_9TELE|nr:hypothetical protein Q8A67_008053 [Cirrhinus molitorella]